MGDWSVVPEASESDWSVVPESKGYDPRAPARGMRPEPKPDEDIQLQSTEEPPGFLRKAFPRATERSRREDPISNDPLAGMIVQGIMAHGAGALVGGATGVPILGQAAQGAVQAPEHPFVGAGLSMIPGVPGAVGQADRAIGRIAQGRVSAGKSFVPAASAAGTAAGTMVGHSAVPYVGAPIGAALGAKLGASGGRLADRAVGALGQRHLLRTAAAAPPIPPAELGAILAQTEPAATRAPLAPLVHQPLPEPQLPPEMLRGPPSASFDEFTRPGGAAGHATIGGATAAGPLRADVPMAQLALPPMPPAAFAAYEPPPFTAGPMKPVIDVRPEIPGLHADVARDARALLRSPVQGPAIEDTLGADLAKNVRLLDELRAGEITAQQALDAGLPSAIVKKALH